MTRAGLRVRGKRARPNGNPPSLPNPAAVRVSASIAAFAIFFFALAVAAFFIGVHDAALADVSLGVTGASAVLMAVGVVLVLAAYQLAGLSRRTSWPDGKRPPCKALVLVAFLLVLLVSVYVFFAAIRGVGAQRLVVVSVALVLMALALVGLVFFGSEARVTLPRLGTIALGLIGTTFAAWQFWYQNDFAPTHAGRAVTLKADLELVGRRTREDVVRATVGFEAITGRSVSVVGSAYTLTGVRIVRCHRREPVDAQAVASVFEGFLLDPQRSRFMADVREQQPGTLLAAGKFAADGRRLESNVPYVRNS